mmetsp:Transcript_46328/g.75884  ORF Transcript_46328/g.75884 Transcript_46328/m.75884 type:complete len:216 (-) Transcript_46328:300-947(-)
MNPKAQNFSVRAHVCTLKGVNLKRCGTALPPLCRPPAKRRLDMLREMGREMLLTCSACSRCPRSKHSPLLSSGVSPRDRLVLQFGRGKEGNACRCVHALPASPSHACLRPEGPESAGATPSNATVVAAPTALAFGIVHRVNRELRRQCVVCRALRLQCTGCTWRPPNDSTSPTGTKGDPHRNRCTRHNTWTQLPGGGGGGGGCNEGTIIIFERGR